MRPYRKTHTMEQYMISPEVLNYIVGQAQRGVPVADIKRNLMQQGGWSENEVYEALRLVGIDKLEALRPVGEIRPPTAAQIALKVRDRKHAVRKGLYGLGGLVALGLVVWGGFNAYGYYFRSGEQAVEAMVESLPRIRAFEFDAKLASELAFSNVFLPFSDTAGVSNRMERTNDVANINLLLNGTVDFLDQQNPKAALRLSGEAITSSFGAGNKLQASLDLRLVERILYVRFERLPDIPFLAAGPQNEWIKIGEQDAADQFGVTVTAPPPEVKERMGQIAEIVRKNRVFSFVKKKAVETGAGLADPIAITLNKGGAYEAIRELGQEFPQEFGPAVQEGLSDFVDHVDIKNFEIWVGRRDHLPHHLTLDVAFEATERSPVSGKTLISVSLRKFNVPGPVKIPVPATSLGEAMKRLLRGGVTATSTKPAKQLPVLQKGSAEILDL